MFKFKDMIFLGNGEHSMAKCYHAHKLLDEAFETLSGLQQMPGAPCGINAKDIERQINDGEIDYIMILQELLLGLTGKKFSSKKLRKFLGWGNDGNK